MTTSRSLLEVTVLYRRGLLALVVGLTLAPGLAAAWWNDDWGARKPLRLDASAAGANVTEPIGASAVLVRLHAGNFRFDVAKEDGSDLRFIAADDKTPLKHHVEKYDAMLGEALIWVGVPDLKPGARTDLWLYYKNPKAVAAEDVKGTWDPATALVYHFTERGQPARDSSSWGNQALNAGTSAEGTLMGRGLRFDGSSPPLQLPAGPSLAWAARGPMTWSVWIKPAEAESTGVLFSRRQGHAVLIIGLEGGRAYLEAGVGPGAARAAGTTALTPTWHHLAVTGGEQLVLYVDGQPAARLAAPLPALEGPSLLGGDAAPAATAPAGKGAGKVKAAAPPAGYRGDLDELQIASVVRPPGFFQVAAISQGTDPGKFLVAGQDEESGGLSGGYMAVILKSVTLDGWVVIGLLGVMAVVSWMVMASKASYLKAVERSNRTFQEAFMHLSADLDQLVEAAEAGHELGDQKALKDSPLNRLYRIAAEEILKRSRMGRPLNVAAIESIRASLDAGLVRENQRLSRGMVLLTIAISGGPFLGLLGTVVGVMITFAAIAAAGDVNVNAIAPGIAAALVATVAGLAVAIPALFGYNWLLTRVKEITATLQVFADELVTKIAEAYSNNGTRDLGARPSIRAAE